MTAGRIDFDSLLERRDRLFTPDPRLGWVFRDRFWFLKPFPEKPPQPQHMPEYLERRVAETEQLAQRRLSRTLPASMTGAVLLLLFAGCSAHDYALSRTPVPFGSFLLALIVAAPGGLLTLVAVRQRNSARQAYELAHRQTVGGYDNAVRDWEARRQAHDQAGEGGPVGRCAGEGAGGGAFERDDGGIAFDRGEGTAAVGGGVQQGWSPPSQSRPSRRQPDGPPGYCPPPLFGHHRRDDRP